MFVLFFVDIRAEEFIVFLMQHSNEIIFNIQCYPITVRQSKLLVPFVYCFKRSDRYQFLCLPEKALVLSELGQPVTLVSTVIVRFGECCIRYYRLLPLTRLGHNTKRSI